MIFRTDGLKVGLDVATFSEFGFGRLPRTGAVPYSLEVDEDEFIRRISPAYQKAIEELEHDDQLVGGFHPPYPGATRYPTLGELLRIREDYRMEFIEVTIKADILNCFWLEGSMRPSILWILQTLDSLSLADEVVRVAGIAVPASVQSVPSVQSVQAPLSTRESGPKKDVPSVQSVQSPLSTGVQSVQSVQSPLSTGESGPKKDE